MPKELEEYIDDYLDVVVESAHEVAEVHGRRHVRVALTVKAMFRDPLVRHNVVLGFEELLRWLIPRLDLGDPLEEMLRRQQELEAREAELDRRERAVTKRERHVTRSLTTDQQRRDAEGSAPGPALWKEEDDVALHDSLRDWVRVKKSKIPDSGSGVFASRDFSAGQLITRVNGRIMALTTALRLKFSMYQVQTDTHAVRMEARERASYALAPHTFTSGVGMFVNSVDFTEHVANVRYQCVQPRSARSAAGRAMGAGPVFYIQATRDVRKGEELLVPTYGIEYWRKVLAAA